MTKVSFTAGRIANFKSPPEKKQAFLWDSTVHGLGLRATPNGTPAFVFQAPYQGQDIRMTIGQPRPPGPWSLTDAQEKAREYQRLIDQGQDPREQKRQTIAAENAQKADRKANAITVAEVWALYLEERKPEWGELNYRDHIKLAQPGGEPRRRMAGVKTKPGPLAEVMTWRLIDVTRERIEEWAAKESKERASRTRLSVRLLKAFLNWASERPELKGKVDVGAVKSKRMRQQLGKPTVMLGSLQRAQLSAWFEQVQKIKNPVISAYLQCTLLTGRRREEMATLKWRDVDAQWNTLDLKDKSVGRTQIPLPPYIKHLLSGLPRRNEWVFSSLTSASGRLHEPTRAHQTACAAAGFNLTIHDLRRSFASLCEWLYIPGGVSAQIQGHAPQGTREQNYIRRPIDLLHIHHVRIEAWILEQAKVKFNASERPNHASDTTLVNEDLRLDSLHHSPPSNRISP